MLEGFEWDARKAEENLRKHGVSFYEAVTALVEPLAVTILDEAHSRDEARYISVGLSHRNRTLVVVHTERDEAIRIISARPTTPRERREYESGK